MGYFLEDNPSIHLYHKVCFIRGRVIKKRDGEIESIILTDTPHLARILNPAS